VGEDLARPRQPGRRRVSREGRPAEGARPDRLQPGRLRLHHLHRQFRPAAGADLQDDQRQGPDRGRRAFRQPQLRGPRLARRAGELPRLAAAGRRLCAGRHRDQGPDHRADRRGPRRQAGLPARHLADQPGDRQFIAENVTRELFARKYADVFKGDEYWQKVQGAVRPDLRLGRQLDLRAEPALFRRHGPSPAPSATSRAPASSACSATRSPPTTSRRPARSRRRPRPASTSSTTASASPTSTSTARAAAITR
jgi:hypothetical protein